MDQEEQHHMNLTMISLLGIVMVVGLVALILESGIGQGINLSGQADIVNKEEVRHCTETCTGGGDIKQCIMGCLDRTEPEETHEFTQDEENIAGDVTRRTLGGTRR